MECPSCYENFNHNERAPRNLLCGHTFCEKCLATLQNSKIFSCPICRKMHAPFNAADLPKNYIALELVQKQHEHCISPDACPHHPKEQPKLYCITCASLICSECVIDHSGHQFIKKSESSIFTFNLVAYVFRTHIEDLVTIISESIEEADAHIANFKAEQKQLAEYAARQNALFIEVIEKIIALLKAAEEKTKNEFNLALEIAEKKIAADLLKFGKTKEELKAASIELGNIMDTLEAGDKLTKEKEENDKLDAIKARVKQLRGKCSKQASPIARPPSYDFQIEKFSAVIKDSFKVQINDGINKKICLFGEKRRVLKFNLDSEAWEMCEIQGTSELQYYSAAVSTHDGNALIVGGGACQDTYLYVEAKSIS